jgi:hypothetical protein
MTYYVVRTKFHGGGIVSRHRVEARADEAARRYSRGGCCCGCAGVVTADEYDTLPSVDDAWSAFDLAHGADPFRISPRHREERRP